MTTRGDYSSLPGTVEELAAEAERALLEQGGSDHPDAHTYAAQAGAAMRTFFEPWFDVPDPAGAADVDEEMKAQSAAMVRYSHDMDDAAGVLDRAGSVVQDALSDSTYDLWSRQGVGMAPTAGMYEYRACLASVSELIEQTAVNTRDAAAHLRKVAALFVDTDEGVRRAMDELRRHERRIERRIEAEEAPETPQWPGGRPPHISRPGVTPW